MKMTWNLSLDMDTERDTAESYWEVVQKETATNPDEDESDSQHMG